MSKQFIIKMEFEQVITAENEEKATDIFYTKFNALDLSDLNLKINFKYRYKNMKKIEYENNNKSSVLCARFIFKIQNIIMVKKIRKLKYYPMIWSESSLTMEKIEKKFSSTFNIKEQTR